MSDYLGYERAFKNAGIAYDVEPGAYQRGHGDLNDVRFIVLHHTAGGNNAGDIRIVRDGRPDLEGPLSQIVLQRNGKPRIMAVGVCWHAYGTIAFREVPAGSGNYYSIGVEGVSNGRDDWTPEQREMYPKVVAALLFDMKMVEGKNVDERAWIFHRDYQPGEKIDPVGFTAKYMQDGISAFWRQLEKGNIVNKVKSLISGKEMTAEEMLQFIDYHVNKIHELSEQIVKLQRQILDKK